MKSSVDPAAFAASLQLDNTMQQVWLYYARSTSITFPCKVLLARSREIRYLAEDHIGDDIF